jgi:hypothetical protein
LRGRLDRLERIHAVGRLLCFEYGSVAERRGSCDALRRGRECSYAPYGMCLGRQRAAVPALRSD